MLEKANNIKRSNTNSKNEIVCCLLSTHRGGTTQTRRRDGSSLTGVWLEPGMGLPGLGWVEGVSKGAVLSMEVRCTQLLVGICLGEGLPPPHPAACPLCPMLWVCPSGHWGICSSASVRAPLGHAACAGCLLLGRWW